MGAFQFVGFLILFLSNLDLSQQFNTDSDYLKSFLQAAGVKSGTYNFASPVCSWPGVGCDIQQVYILNLTITGAGLTGPVAENSLGKLMNLEFLDLDDNFITELASDIWGLSKLKYLSLSNNNLSGALSNNIGNFGALSRLDLTEQAIGFYSAGSWVSNSSSFSESQPQFVQWRYSSRNIFSEIPCSFGSFLQPVDRRDSSGIKPISSKA